MHKIWFVCGFVPCGRGGDHTPNGNTLDSVHPRLFSLRCVHKSIRIGYCKWYMQGNFSINTPNKLTIRFVTCKIFYNMATVPSYFQDGIVASCIIIIFFFSLSPTQLFLSFFFLFFSLILSFFHPQFSLPLSHLSLSFKACHRSWVGFGVVMMW